MALHSAILVTGRGHREDCDILDKICAWEERADEVKQRGFYVDWRNNSWHLPRNTSEDDLKMALFTCKTLLAYAKSLASRDA